MYHTDELIIYGSTGVCRVEEIVTGDRVKKISRGLDKNRSYYLLKPLYQTGSIFTPTDNTKVFMRPIISKEEADHFIDMIPQMKAEAFHTDRMQELQNHYQEATQSHNCADLIELIMSIYAKKQFVEQQNRKFGQVDERFMKRAEDMLYGEFSVALGIEKEDVPAYISARISTVGSGAF